MTERIQRRRARGESDESVADEARQAPAASDYDAILAEIDEVLSTDAEEYVRNFVQKGGQ